MSKIKIPGQTQQQNKIELRPELVRVFGRNFYVNYPSSETGMQDLGLTHFHQSLVNVVDGQSAVEERDTLLHEFIHVIDLTMELELTEKQVTCLAHGLIGVFNDNPEFAKFVTDNTNSV